MAEIYGRLTGNPAGCLGTLGPGATNLITGVADSNMDRSPLREPEHISADHYPFMAAGVPSSFLRDPGFSISAGFYHTAHDTVDKLRLTDIREAAFLAARLMWRVANEERWPFSRTPAEERLRLQREYDRLEVRRVEAEVEKLRAGKMEK